MTATIVAAAIADTLNPHPTATSTALIGMARRYGTASLEMGEADHGTPEYRQALRAMARQYKAMLRLTAALAATGGAR